MKSKNEKTHTDVVRELLLSQKNQEIVNIATGISASFGVKGINKMLSNTAVNKSIRNGFTRDEHIDSVANINTLFTNAVLSEVSSDEKNHSSSLKSVKRFIAEADTNTIVYITVKESAINGHRIYSVELKKDKASLDKGKP
ncbi:MAG: hypothetical protein IKN43_03440 [Selenomonadaceae bacterium]|nr:hypothetical protein [Selenomonadaceae bacterium]